MKNLSLPSLTVKAETFRRSMNFWLLPPMWVQDRTHLFLLDSI